MNFFFHPDFDLFERRLKDQVFEKVKEDDDDFDDIYDGDDDEDDDA